MSDTHNTPEKQSRLRRFYDRHAGEIMTYGVLLALGLIIVFVVIPGLEKDQLRQVDRAKQFIAKRASAAEANFRLPNEAQEWYLQVGNDFFLCSHVTLIPLQGYTTVINESGNYFDPSGESVTISSTTTTPPNRCWNKDQTTFTETSYYEFSDCTCLILATYVRAEKGFGYDDALNWQRVAATSIPMEWKEIN